jgi:hypothetical protein
MYYTKLARAKNNGGAEGRGRRASERVGSNIPPSEEQKEKVKNVKPMKTYENILDIYKKKPTM